MRGLLLLCCRLNIYRSALIFRNLPCPEKFLVTRLNIQINIYIRKQLLLLVVNQTEKKNKKIKVKKNVKKISANNILKIEDQARKGFLIKNVRRKKCS